MKFIIKTNESILGLGRTLGYKPLGNRNDEYSFARPLGDNYYPRFHIYVRREKDALFFNLHLDQKKPSYAGTTAHSGEYDGELVEIEAERIKGILGRRSQSLNIF